MTARIHTRGRDPWSSPRRTGYHNIDRHGPLIGMDYPRPSIFALLKRLLSTGDTK